MKCKGNFKMTHESGTSKSDDAPKYINLYIFKTYDAILDVGQKEHHNAQFYVVVFDLVV